jgi:hypothetical protein
MKDGKIYGCPPPQRWAVICGAPGAQHIGGGTSYNDRDAALVCASGHRQFLGCDNVSVEGRDDR